MLTFRKADLKERFVRSSVLKVNGAPYAIQDVDRPLTFVQIFDAPHELPDSAIIQRLAVNCEVVTYRRGFFRDPGWENVQDGSRHYRVRMKKPTPAICALENNLFSFVMLDSLKRAAFVILLRILPTPVIPSFVLTAKKPAIWLAIVPLPSPVIFAKPQLI